MSRLERFFIRNNVHKNAVNILAIVGFVSLVSIGIYFAFYTSQFMPKIVKNMEYASVSLSNVLLQKKQNSLIVVPQPKTSFVKKSQIKNTNLEKITKVKQPVTQPKRKINTTHAGKQTLGTYTIQSTTTPLYGLPDLTTKILETGYMTSTSTNSFVATTTIPYGSRVAIKFSVTNDGTNLTGLWTFRASIPTESSYIFNSPKQQSLNPGDHISYILGFDQGIPGTNQMISITADADKSITESNETNNSASANVKILGK